MPAEMKIRAHITVTGHVQGVFFRHETAKRAKALGVTGWVRNVEGGTVEAVFEGPERVVEELIAWCRRGPKFASVSKVQVERQDLRGEEGFRVR